MATDSGADTVRRPDYSLVIPVYNESACLPELVRRLTDLMAKLDGPAEVILVDDGSDDGGDGFMLDVSRGDDRFRMIQLSRNFGHQIALTAGLDFASGQAVVAMDADLQDPPEVVLEMAARWREGYEVVYAVREQREGESTLKKTSASWYYTVLRKLTDVDAPANVGDFRLVDRKALDAFRQMREHNRYVRGMFGWIGYRQIGVPYARSPRYSGDTKYPFRKMMRLAFDGIASFSAVPLRFALRVGFVLAIVSFIAGITAIVLHMTGTLLVPGWASLIVAISFMGGVQLLTLGVLGEYIARIYDEVQGRPLYLVRETHGFPGQAPPVGDRVRVSMPSLDERVGAAEDVPTMPPR